MTVDTISERSAPDIRITCPADLFPALRKLASKRVEHFWTANLNAAQVVQRINLISVGTLNRCLIHPREVFRPAIVQSSFAIILIHNHPSGDLTPSREDKEMTQRLVSVAKIIGIEILDHLIVSKLGYFSFREKGEL